jgi:hypothetical protein
MPDAKRDMLLVVRTALHDFENVRVLFLDACKALNKNLEWGDSTRDLQEEVVQSLCALSACVRDVGGGIAFQRFLELAEEADDASKI